MAAPTARLADNLLSRFKGSLVGGVLGDCLGSNFERFWDIRVPQVLDFFNKLETQTESKKTWASNAFTDDTAMARSVASSLIAKKGLDTQDMASRFVQEYYAEPNRGYGSAVGVVFHSLREGECKDVFGPASKQFDGAGSYGNGGAMRISPAGVFGYSWPLDKLEDVVRRITKITHSHRDAINGAILQATAVHLALHENSSHLNTSNFLDKLREKMHAVEIADNNCEEDVEQPFCQKLDVIREFLERSEVNREEIEESLGTDVAALESVPAAIYAFLRCSKPVSDVKWENPFERTLIYAVSLGGDTDTIATMACAIAGAYYGIENIPSKWQRVCEGVKDALDYSEKMFEIRSEV